MNKLIQAAILIICAFLIIPATIMFVLWQPARSQGVSDAIDGLWTMNDYLNEELFANDEEGKGEIKLTKGFIEASQRVLSAVRLESESISGLVNSRVRMSKDDRRLLKKALRSLQRLDEVLSDTKADWRSDEYLDKLFEPLSVLSATLANDMISPNLQVTASHEPYDWETEN
jgi:hypothetical protein